MSTRDARTSGRQTSRSSRAKAGTHAFCRVALQCGLKESVAAHPGVAQTVGPFESHR